MKTDELLKFGAIKLRDSNIEEPILKARILLSHLLNTSKLSNGLTLARWILFTINLEHLIYDTNL